MNVMNRTSLDAPRRTGGLSSLAEKHRSLLAALTAAISLNVAACSGGGNGNENPGGSAGVAGSAGEGGTGGTGGTGGDAGPDVDAGGSAGTAGEGGVNNCVGRTVPDGLADVILEHGKIGAAIVAKPQNDPESAYNGGGLEIVSGNTVEDSATIGEVRYIVRSLTLVSAPAGYNVATQQSGYDYEAVPANNQMAPDGFGGCIPNRLNLRVDLAPNEMPIGRSPSGLYATAAYKDGSDFTVLDQGQTSKLTQNGTEAQLTQLGELAFLNEVPQGDITASVDSNGKVRFSIGSMTDQGEAVHDRMSLEVDGYTFIRDPQNPSEFVSEESFDDGQYNFSGNVNGLNHANFGGDQKPFNLVVDVTGQDLCASKDCNDNNDCTDDSCNPADGNCINEPEVDKACNDNNAHTINDVCDDQGVCAGELADCIDDSECNDNNACNGVETCNTTSNECENGTPIDHNDGNACNGVEGCNPADGSLVPGTPIDHDDGLACNGVEGCDDTDGSKIDGTPIDCNNGTCGEPGTCACDAGFAEPDCNSCETGYTEPNCDSCEPGYEGYPNCTPDITAPGAPVITTNGGNNFTTNNSTVGVNGTTDIDTDEMYSKVNGGAYSLIPGYTANNPNWSRTFGISAGQTNTYCFAAEDWSNNMSAEDCITATRPYPAPVISGLAIDCSSTSGYCVAGGVTYPVNWNVENASNCSTSLERTSGVGTVGSNSTVVLNGNDGSVNHTTGSGTGNIKLTTNCNGPGGSDSASTQFQLW